MKSKRKRVLNLHWPESDVSRIGIIFTDGIVEIDKFIEEAEDLFESVLVYCNNGQNRALTVAVCYLIRNFRWGFKKTLEYIYSKRPQLIIKQKLFQTLQSVAEEYSKAIATSSIWKNDFQSLGLHRDEEVLLTNTYINAQKASTNIDTSYVLARHLKNRSYERKALKTVKWADQQKKDRIKAKSTHRISILPSSMKNNPNKPHNDFKSKYKFKSVRKEVDALEKVPVSSKYEEKSKFTLLKSSGILQKNIRQIQMKILSHQSRDKKKKDELFNNSFSKSTNVQDDLSTIEKKDADESKMEAFRMVKLGNLDNISLIQLKNSFFKDLKFLNDAKDKTHITEPAIDKSTDQLTTEAKYSHLTDKKIGNLSNKKLSQIIKQKMGRTRVSRFELPKSHVGRLYHKNQADNNHESLIDRSKVDNLQLDSKTDNNYVKTRIIMKNLLAQRNPDLNVMTTDRGKRSIDIKNGKDQKRPSSALTKGNLTR